MATCQWCGASMLRGRGPERKWCSAKCARSGQRIRQAEAKGPPLDIPLPRQSDYPVAPPQRHVAVCMACGRSTRPSDGQEWRRAIMERSCGIPACRGFLIIEVEDVWLVGSPNASHPIRIDSRQRLVVPRRRTA